MSSRSEAGSISLTLRDIQVDQKAWADRNFGGHRPHHPLLGMNEEIGEMVAPLIGLLDLQDVSGRIGHHYLKMDQAIRGTPEEHMAKIRDGVGDLMIFLMNFASSLDIDLQDALESTWREVRSRDWVRFPKDGRAE